MQDALVGATDKKNSSHEKDGEVFYDYEVTGAVSKHIHSSHPSRDGAFYISQPIQLSYHLCFAEFALPGIHYAQEWQGVCPVCQIANQGKSENGAMHCFPLSGITSIVLVMCRTTQQTKTS